MDSLLELTACFDRVSIVGMCKNAGKTTVLNRMLKECGAAGLNAALCSVGRDGEKIDVVTKQKKPEILINEGTLFATAGSLISSCEVEKERLLSTGVRTALGEVIVYRAISRGLIELSGPSMNSQLPTLIRYFQSCGAEKVLIDGAVSRKASSSPTVASCTILCTGADYNSDIEAVVADTAHAAALLSTEALQDERAKAIIASHKERSVLLISNDYSQAAYGLYETIPEKDKTSAKYAYFPGALTDRLCESALGGGQTAEGFTLVSAYASKLMISRGMAAKLASRGIGLLVLDPVSVACICVNPHCTSGPDFDRESLRSKMQGAVSLPVINVADCTLL